MSKKKKSGIKVETVTSAINLITAILNLITLIIMIKG